jgi:outer membrane protein assembly factor BamB
VGYLGDRVLAATSSRLFALAPGDGRKIWEFDPADPRGERQKPNPFNRTAPGAEPARAPDEPAATGRLRGFRLVGPRIYLLRGDRELLAVDAETGQLDWSYAPAGGGINRHLLVTPTRVVLQASKPRSLVVLDAESGRLRGEFPRAEAEEPWGADPLPLDDDHVVVSADPKTVSLIDLSRGAAVWAYRDDSELPRFEPPLLFSDSGRLLALFGGNTLVRLDPATGKPLWESPLGAVDLSGRPGAFAFDGERIFCASLRREGRESGKSPSVPVLTAYDLADGSVEWRRHLVGPASGWELALTDRCVVAYPTPSRSDDGPLDELPLGLYRREDGRPVGRLTFEAPVRSLAVWFDPRATLVATEGRVWSLGAPAGPDRAP